ncbi:C-type lectin domain family 4 member E-like [Seriola lalandi dorsalis]|uniref:C-type lectin domain family 4 member E-like n=1 Tax=Seriola lalandi dorsalis TaxID=1841481 RepID=UPI000C6F754E|nr:C-type lectin domain family 4 member E-like [Seriola lalandi dorsalis]
MTATGSSPAFDGMYSQLIEDEGTYDELHRKTDVGHSAHPVSRVMLPSRLSGSGPYRLTTICLATLCAILLISIIAVTAHSPEVIKPTEAAIVCPVDWQLFNNSCYFISRVQRDWAESRSYCQSKGAHLAIIHTAEEQTFLWNLLPRGHWNAYWFGITDAQTEDQWKWVDGTPLVGGFWEVGEPNNHINEDCGYIVKTRVLTRVPIRSWYDAPCTMALPYICEKEMSAGASTAIPH